MLFPSDAPLMMDLSNGFWSPRFEDVLSALLPHKRVVLVFWPTVIFISFGLFAPRNATVVATLLICALSVSAAIFLILEMHAPLAD
jgi:hypothetical protein